MTATKIQSHRFSSVLRRTVLRGGQVAVLLVLIGLSFGGCDSAVTGEDLFRYSLDNQVGEPMLEAWKRQAKARTGIDGRTEYIFTRPNGCSWAMVVDKYDVIVEWYFVSDPSLCRSKFKKGAQ